MNKTSLQVDQKPILILDDFLSDSDLLKVRLLAKTFPLIRGGSSHADGRTLHYVGNGDLKILQELPVARKLADYLGSEFPAMAFTCERIIYREIVYGDHLEYHTDANQEGIFTAILYLNEQWKPEDRGETLFLGANDIGVNVLPRPGRILFFDGRISHSTNAPSRLYFDSRKILVFNFHGKTKE